MISPNIDTWKIVAANNNLCGEAPYWDAARQRLFWTDLASNLVFQLDDATGQHSQLCRDLMVSGIALDRSGKLVFSGAGGLHIWQEGGTPETLFSKHDGENLCFNDLVADSQGRIYTGTYYWGPSSMERPGKLFLIGRGGQIQVVDEGLQLSNGLTFSPDGRTLYLADSTARRIYAYDVDTKSGALSNKRTLIESTVEDGLPDGITADSEGFLWVAHWYGSQVVRYDPEGRVVQRLRLPVRQVSSVALGGPELDQLYVTSASDPWPSDFAPADYDPKSSDMGGSLYRVQVDVPGKLDYLADLG